VDVPLPAGYGADRAAADAGQLGDLPLAELSFREEALDLLDQIW
jgi:hypothetical protein